MRDFDEFNITAAVLESFAKTPDPRLRQILSSLVQHLHAFVRDIEPSFEEWSFAIDFLTRTGHMCTDKRQEFILLSDTLGVSMLVDALNHRMPAGTTETTVLGPFYVENPPVLPLGADVAGAAAGERLFVSGTVADATGQPLGGAIVDIWHSDQDGFYDVQIKTEPCLRARFMTDAAGHFHFWTIMPRWYPIPDDGPVGDMLGATARHPNRPAHVHFMIQAEGYEMLVTHVFADDSPYLDSDAVFGVKNSLIAHFAHEPPGEAPDGSRQERPWRHLTYDFGLRRVLQPAEASKHQNPET